MAIAEVEARRNGTAVPMPIKTVEIKLEEIGYPGWSVTMRTDPRSSVYDSLVSGDDERWWQAFGQLVVDWQITDDDGKPLKLPKEVGSEKDLDLRVGMLGFILNRYFDAVRAASAIPKEPSADSERSSSTSGEGQRSG